MNNMNIVIPMLGFGTRFKNTTSIPKPLVKVYNKTLIEHSVESLGISGKYIFITRKYEDASYNKELTKIFDKLDIDYIELQTQKNTSGATETCLLASDYINNDDQLIITNCDQLMKWNANLFLNRIQETNADGALVLFKSNNSKHSFAIIKDNLVLEVKEKKAISNNALVGIHYWKNGRFFVNSANSFINHYKNDNILETYISETYNYLIKHYKNIVPFFINNNEYISLGTPKDIEIYSRGNNANL